MSSTNRVVGLKIFYISKIMKNNPTLLVTYLSFRIFVNPERDFLGQVLVSKLNLNKTKI